MNSERQLPRKSGASRRGDGLAFGLGNAAARRRDARQTRRRARGARGLRASHAGSAVRVRRIGRSRAACARSSPAPAARRICRACSRRRRPCRCSACRCSRRRSTAWIRCCRSCRCRPAFRWRRSRSARRARATRRCSPRRCSPPIIRTSPNASTKFRSEQTDQVLAKPDPRDALMATRRHPRRRTARAHARARRRAARRALPRRRQRGRCVRRAGRAADRRRLARFRRAGEIRRGHRCRDVRFRERAGRNRAVADRAHARVAESARVVGGAGSARRKIDVPRTRTRHAGVRDGRFAATICARPCATIGVPSRAEDASSRLRRQRPVPPAQRKRCRRGMGSAGAARRRSSKRGCRSSAKCRSSPCAARDGAFSTYPLVQNWHADGILSASLAPAPDSAGLAEVATHHARRIAEHLDYVGVFALELFVRDGKLLGNEMAPRVHNSGHWTIEGAVCSQFENHVRAVLGLAARRYVGVRRQRACSTGSASCRMRNRCWPNRTRTGTTTANRRAKDARSDTPRSARGQRGTALASVAHRHRARP